MDLTREALARMIDHTLLKPEATASLIDALCAQARERSFHSVCVNPYWVARAGKALEGADVTVCTVIGFPLGSNTPAQKSAEARIAVADGARELDMVMNVGAFLSGETGAVKDDIAAVVAAAKGAVVKVILETGFLDDDGIAAACGIAVDSGADFVKTSTGFGPPPLVDHVKVMREAVGDRARVKAAGGIRTFSDAVDMVRAGANRLGTSSGVAIMEGWEPTEV